MISTPNHNNFKFLGTGNKFEPSAYQMGKWNCSGFKPGKIPKYKIRYRNTLAGGD